MPISEKIKKEIKHSNASEEEKQLIMDILCIEDEGNYRYQAAYEKVIKDYLSKKQGGKYHGNND